MTAFRQNMMTTISIPTRTELVRRASEMIPTLQEHASWNEQHGVQELSEDFLTLSDRTIRYGLDHGFVVPLFASATARLCDQCETMGISALPNQWVGQCRLIIPL